MHDSAVGMTAKSYYEMCEALGTEPIEGEVPIELHDLPYIVQQCFTIYHVLPDIWDTMGGGYMGKDYSIVFNLFDLYSVEESERIISLDIMRLMDNERARVVKEKIKSTSSST